MTARQHAAEAVNAATAGFTVWAIGHLLRGPGARPSMPRDFGVGALVVGGVLALSTPRKEQLRATSN